MDNISGVEVKQPFTHAEDDGAFDRWRQLQRHKYKIKFSWTGIKYLNHEIETNFITVEKKRRENKYHHGQIRVIVCS